LVNGRERKDIFDGDFFRELTIISQVPYLFSGTVKNNLTLFDGLKTEKLKEIPLVTEEMTGLLEDDRFVSNESAHISSGEREKMAIIRALLKESRWLILDEATAALDRQSKKMFEEYLLKRKDLTVIHISHTYREEDKENYDEVIRIGE
jgi:ABC-type multidrug transport system fused ATPase/permease subunit